MTGARPGLRDRPTFLVAAREFTERVGRRSYWVILAATMAAIAALIVIPSLISSNGERVRVTVVGLDGSGQALRESVEQAANALGIDVSVEAVAAVGDARRTVRESRSDIAVTGPDELLIENAPSEDDSGAVPRLLSGLSSQLRAEAAMTSAGVTEQQLSALREGPAPRIVTLERTDPDQGARRATATVLNILLLLLLQLYGSWVLNGVTEEKTSRVAEVLLSSTGPRPLLTGKLSGVGLAALLHGGALVATAVVAATASGSDLLRQIDLATLPWSLAWLMLGYGFYCCVYAAVGATVSRVEEAQSAAFPILLPLLFTYLLAFTVIYADSTPWYFTVLAYLPPTAPIAMAVLQANDQASAWQGLISMGVTVAGIFVVARLAAAVYKGSILHTSGRIRFRDALRNDDMSAGVR